MTCLGRHRGQAEVYLQPIRNPVPRRMWKVITTIHQLYSRERPRTYGSGNRVGLGATLNGTENLSTTGIRSPDISTNSESLYRLRFLGPEAQQASSTRGTGPFLRVQRPELGVKRLTPPSTDVRNGWSYTSFLPSVYITFTFHYCISFLTSNSRFSSRLCFWDIKGGVNVRGKQKERPATKPGKTKPEAQGDFLGILGKDKEQLLLGC